MKNHRATLKAIAAAALLCAAGFAQAGGSATVNVSATVNTVCKFTLATATIAFGALDPDAGAQSKDGTLEYKCTNGASAPTVSFATGTGSRTMTDGAKSLPYTMTIGATAAGTGFGAGQEKQLTITADIDATDLANAQAGSYTGAVTLNISP
jgi:hypothetical protein